MMSKEFTVWSNWQLNPCRLKSTNDYRGEIALLLLPTKKKIKERGKLVTLSLTLRSPKGGTATSMWMERTRLGPTG